MSEQPLDLSQRVAALEAWQRSEMERRAEFAAAVGGALAAYEQAQGLYRRAGAEMDTVRACVAAPSECSGAG